MIDVQFFPTLKFTDPVGEKKKLKKKKTSCPFYIESSTNFFFLEEVK